MDRSVGLSDSLQQGHLLRLAGRFQVVQVSPTDCRLVSLTQTLRVTVPEETIDLFPQVVDELRRGTTLERLMRLFGSAENAVRSIVSDFEGQGLLDSISLEESARLSPEEGRRYDEQVRFLANFRVPGDGPLAEPDPRSPGPEMHRRLSDARVMLIGLGQAGERVAACLAGAGVRRLFGHDPAPVTVDLVGVGGFQPHDVGRNRQDVVSHRLSAASEVDFCPLGDPFAEEAWSNVDLIILCSDGYDRELYGRVNALALERNTRWISYRAAGIGYEVGPLVVPHETACYRCLEYRRAANAPLYDEAASVATQLTREGKSIGSLPIAFGADVVALEAIRLLSGFARPLTYGAVFTFDLLSYEGALHPVLKIPRCRACSRGKSRPSMMVWRPEGNS